MSDRGYDDSGTSIDRALNSIEDMLSEYKNSTRIECKSITHRNPNDTFIDIETTDETIITFKPNQIVELRYCTSPRRNNFFEIRTNTGTYRLNGDPRKHETFLYLCNLFQLGNIR